MTEILLIATALVVGLWLVATLFLLAPDHSQYDRPVAGSLHGRTGPSAENAEVLRRFERLVPAIRGQSFMKRIRALRDALDGGIIDAPVAPAALGVTAHPTHAGGVPAEWVIAPQADADRRLLYIHGGGFIAGSPSSARMVVAELGKRLGVAVLSVDYRLAPENRRIHGIRDVQEAYQWMLGNAWDGARPAREVIVAGDSAGGNLALMLSAWSRDTGVRPMDAVVAFAPSTDASLSAPSFRDNFETDPLLGPPLRPLMLMPAFLRAWLILLVSQMSPRNPLASPLFGDLGGLPPTLIQSSDCECLSGDARRYVNKATDSGSDARLQVWPGMYHVFQMYGHIIPEAGEAFGCVARFIEDIRQERIAASRDECTGPNEL